VVLSLIMLAVAKKQKKTFTEKLKPVFMAIALFGGFFTLVFVIGDFIGTLCKFFGETIDVLMS
jgi:uncharacterized membrane protein